MKILISGATSFLGRSLIPKLQKKNCTLLLFTSNKGSFKAEKIFKKKNLKIINQSQIEKIKKFKPDIFLNLQTMYNYNADFKNLSDLIDANIKIPLQLLMLCSNSISRLISPSTYYMYGKNTSIRFFETLCAGATPILINSGGANPVINNNDFWSQNVLFQS